MWVALSAWQVAVTDHRLLTADDVCRNDRVVGTRTADEIARDMQGWLVKFATTEEHDRLERLLKLVASVAGFTTEATFKDGTRPDVLRTADKDPSALLIADAKVAPKDVPGTKDTADQIKGYIHSFKDESAYGSAVFAIATNAKSAADLWVDALKEWISAAGLGAGNFSASRHSDDTWVVIGGIDRPLPASSPGK